MTYFGHKFDSLQCESLRLEHLPTKLSNREPELFQTKWWDYRLMHPVKATYLFADKYRQALVHSLKRRIDVSEAEACFAGQMTDFLSLKKASITGMFKARQAADAAGIPYHFWCALAMHYAEKNLWLTPPTPVQLYGATVNEDHAHFKVSMQQYITEAWLKHCEGRLLCSTHPFYRAENYCKHPYQIAHLMHIRTHLMKAPNRAMLIADLVYERQILTERLVRAIFGGAAEGLLIQSKLFAAEEEVESL